MYKRTFVSDPDNAVIPLSLAFEYLEAVQGKSITQTLGVYNPLTQNVHVDEYRAEWEALFESNKEARRSFNQRMLVYLAKLGSTEVNAEADAFKDDMLNQLTHALRSTPSIAAMVGGEMEEIKQCLDKMISEVIDLYWRRRVEDVALREMRHAVIAQISRVGTLHHELNHYIMSCSTGAQSYLNWLQYIQQQLIIGYLRKAKMAGVKPASAPLIRQLITAKAQGDAFNLAYRLRNWMYMDRFQAVLLGLTQDSLDDVVIFAACSDFLFKSTVSQFGPQLPLREIWSVDMGLPLEACPTDLQGRPYGVLALQEGFATVRSDSTFAMSYSDLLANRPNPVYHGEYLRLPALAVSRLKFAFIDWARYTFLALCDIAMSSHIHPAVLSAFDDGTYHCAWHDLHPGWRFARALEFVTNNRGVVVADPEQDYDAFVTAICGAMKWPTPSDVAEKIRLFDAQLRKGSLLSPMLEREIAFASFRSRRPHFPCKQWEDELPIRPALISYGGGRASGGLSEEAQQLLKQGVMGDVLSQYVCSASYEETGHPMEHLGKLRIATEEFIESVIGWRIEDLWVEAKHT